MKCTTLRKCCKKCIETLNNTMLGMSPKTQDYSCNDHARECRDRTK